MRAEEIIKKYFKTEDGELKIGRRRVTELVQDYPTPLYVYDAAIIREKYRSLKQDLPPCVDIYYSIKANPLLAVCSLLKEQGAGAEVASIGELSLAQKAGYPPERIIFSGPGKSREELRNAIERRILMINAESLQELMDIASFGKSSGKGFGRTIDVGIRVNPKENPTDSQMRMGGGAQKFGIDEERLGEAFDILKREKGRLRLRGVHVYVGTQTFDQESILDSFRNILRIVLEAYDRFPSHQFPSDRFPAGDSLIIDFGPGFGVPYYRTESEPDIETFKRGLAEIIETMQDRAPLKRAVVILEVGRYLVATSGIYLTRVLYTKRSRNKLYAVVDGGMHHNCIGTQNMGQKVPRKFPVAVVNKIDSPCRCKVDIVGPLCTPLDSFGHNFETPEIERGDVVAVFQMGAYGLTASMNRFLSHPVCGEVMVDGDYSQLIREPGDWRRTADGQRLFQRPKSF